MRAWLGMALALGLGACAVGPDFTPPAAPEVAPLAPLSPGEGQRFVEGLDLPGQWWQLFGSPPLDHLIEEALKANPDIAAALAALKVAQENTLAQRGVYYPSVAASFQASRQATPTGALAPAAASGSATFSLFTPQLSVSYVPDLFGLNQRTVESLLAQEEAQRFALEATYLTLTSNVVANAITEALLRAEIAANTEIVALETELLALLKRQNALGQVAEADVAAQEAALAAAEAALPPLQKQLAA
ncbi:MAG TPA: TolC family protein, partial [Stellaceae bacterium]|nr:TolC family protein [Stellaceae bacterium]